MGGEHSSTEPPRLRSLAPLLWKVVGSSMEPLGYVVHPLFIFSVPTVDFQHMPVIYNLDWVVRFSSAKHKFHKGAQPLEMLDVEPRLVGVHAGMERID